MTSSVHRFKAISEIKLELKRTETLNLIQNRFCLAGWPRNLTGDWKTIGHLFYTASSTVHDFQAIGEFKLELQSGMLNSGQSRRFSVPCDLEIWWMTLKNNRAPLQCHLKLCASFQRHRWIQTVATVQKRPVWVKINDFLAVWPRNLTDDLAKQQGTSSYLLQALCIISLPLVNSNWSYSPETLNMGQNRRFFVPWDLEIWQMSLKNNRAPLLCYLKLCASIQTRVTVQQRPIWVQIGDFVSRVTLKFDRWPWKTTEHIFYATPSFVHYFVAICEFKLELQSWNG